MSFTMNGHGHNLQESPCGSEQIAKFRRTVGSKTSSPTKRAFEPVTGDDDVSVPKKARLATPLKDERLAIDEEDSLVLTSAEETALQHPQPRRLPSPLADAVPIDPLDAFVSQWLQTVGSSERNRNCRSDSSLDHLKDEGEDKGEPGSNSNLKRSRQRTRSAPPEMDRKDADGYAIPRTPRSRSDSTNSRSNLDGAIRRSARASDTATARTDQSPSPSGSRVAVEDANYRDVLADNNIHMLSHWTPLPDHVGTLVGQMRRKRDSPGPSLEGIQQDDLLEQVFEGTAESTVEDYFKDNIVPVSASRPLLNRLSRTQLNRKVVPFAGGPGVTRFSTPTPDLLFGYDRKNAFPDPGHLAHLKATDSDVRATKDYAAFIYPFFVIEFKGVGGNMWVAANQCLGGAATCVSIAEGLNRQLRAYSQTEGDAEVVHAVDSTAFSIAMNGNEARLYVSWKHDEFSYYMSAVDCFSLYRPEHYIEFRRMVRNIVDWGKNDRLKAIKRSLDTLLEEARKRTASESKARQRSPETAGSASGGGTSSGSGRSKKPRS